MKTHKHKTTLRSGITVTTTDNHYEKALITVALGDTSITMTMEEARAVRGALGATIKLVALERR
jgi:chromosome segregation ATPase